MEVALLFYAWLVFHVIVCIALVLVVLMQSSKGEGLAGSAFGGGLSSSVFGGRGAASFLSKATTILAALFMLNCGALAVMSTKTRTAAQGGQVTTSESAVTREAQAEMARQQQRQQQQNQQGLPGGTTEGAPSSTPPAQPTTPPAEGGK
ncbi:preprotein translocase subunit SecG [candidate division GN15 bacterium]|uniref:Protein-export membrane protein SecG n=1 Tax=candidate division GN15 bacterium TaxID=2072418 RepID=A0A855X2Y8_9BACT|nr:MAG: preprotein translocase subunit SecG [candidate division GN15 bacterium]